MRLLVRTPAKVGPLMDQLAVDPAALEVVQGDMTDSSAVTDAVRGCEAVGHCAAIVATDPAQAKAMDETNLAGARRTFSGLRSQWAAIRLCIFRRPLRCSQFRPTRWPQSIQ